MTLPVTAAGIAAGCAVLGVLGKLSMTAIEAAKSWVEMTLKTALLEFRRELIEEIETRIKGLPCMHGIIPDTQIRRAHGRAFEETPPYEH